MPDVETVVCFKDSSGDTRRFIANGYVHVIAPQNGLDLQGHVTCLAVQGQAAVVGFEIEKGTGQGASQGAAFLVQDNGSPGRSGDIFGGPLLIATPPTNCNSSVGFLPQSVIQGNIVVK